MSRAQVWVISFSPIAEDARVLKQVRVLAAEHEVTTVGYGPAPAEAVAHYEIPADLVAWHKDRLSLMLRRYRRVQDMNAVIAHLRATLPVGQADVVVANDADTVPVALALRPRAGVHVDLHEYAPRENEESWRWRLFVAPYYRWIIRRFVTRADSVTTVGKGLAAEYRREFGIEAAVVENATAFHDTEPTLVQQPIRLVHSGNARRNRTLELMIDAVTDTSTDVTLDLFLMPNDPAYLAELKERARAANVALGGDRVRVHDPVPYADLVPTLCDYDVGVFVLPPLTFNYRWTLPNKFFDFVQARLGIIVGPSPEMAGLVREHGLGEVTEEFTTASLTQVLDRLTPEMVQQWKAASHARAPEVAAERRSGGWVDAVRVLVGR
ncbi:glycosyltransferase [Ruania alba]|uniref:Glycosyl transferase 4-like domain-containing protein n=1 Tax=Ruania alba TaxID=648782 RepID=A0A1H5N9A2_9MICO|nr:glycosyltransferase [Ruania alba]SEE98212.1 Glycosyl transferase 4-like domain-containing protein [Ruania alba]